MAQFARPTSDDFNTGGADAWVASSGSDMYAMVDETPASDSDYISSEDSGSSSVANVRMPLSTLNDPVSSSGHVIRYRIQWRDTYDMGLDQPTVHVKLMQDQVTDPPTPGNCNHQIWSRTSTYSSNSLNQYSGGDNYGLEEHTLSATQANNITYDGSICFMIQRNSLMGSGETVYLSFVEFEVPDVTATTTTTTTTATPSTTQRRVRLDSLGFGIGIE